MKVEPVLQPELFEPQHVSLQGSRLEHGMPERVYLEHWRKLNERHPSVNRGFTALEWILCPTGLMPGPVTQRDAIVAACVIQWLGTNCGMGFLYSAERRIEELRDAEAPPRTVFPLIFYRPAPKTRLIEVE
jgi:hypothetical protein